MWRRVDKSGGADACWPWLGWRTPDGYGRLSKPGKGNGSIGAHRVALESSLGPLRDGQFACHRCDNPPCCNPAHLFAGTHTDNMRDCASKGRAHGALGAAHHCAKLVGKVAEIVSRYAAGETQRSIADSLGVARVSIRAVLIGQTHKRERLALDVDAVRMEQTALGETGT